MVPLSTVQRSHIRNGLSDDSFFYGLPKLNMDPCFHMEESFCFMVGNTVECAAGLTSISFIAKITVVSSRRAMVTFNRGTVFSLIILRRGLLATTHGVRISAGFLQGILVLPNSIRIMSCCGYFRSMEWQNEENILKRSHAPPFIKPSMRRVVVETHPF